MVTFAMLLAGTSLVVQVADVVPRLDVASTCRAAIALAGNQGRTVESCVAGEEAARKELEKDWAKFPGAERNQCIQTAAKGGSPSYVPKPGNCGHKWRCGPGRPRRWCPTPAT